MIITRLSGNEIYCLSKIGYTYGDFVFGNSLSSLGLRGTIDTEITSVGIELPSITELIKAGRNLALQRMREAATPVSILGVTTELFFHKNHLEFFTTGSTIKNEKSSSFFTTHANGQQFYMQLDAGYQPLSICFGNVVYGTGKTGGMISRLKNPLRGELKKISDDLNQTRQLVLTRLKEQAKEYNANAVIGIETTTTTYNNVNEMLMLGTAAHNQQLKGGNDLITSTLNYQDMWSLAKMGFAPVGVVLASSIVSLGLWDQISSFFNSLVFGEEEELTKLMMQARKNTFANLNDQASKMNADTVVDVKMHIHHLGNGLIEFFAFGTAIKKMATIKTLSEELPIQVLVSKVKDIYS